MLVRDPEHENPCQFVPGILIETSKGGTIEEASFPQPAASNAFTDRPVIVNRTGKAVRLGETWLCCSARFRRVLSGVLYGNFAVFMRV